VGSACDLEEMGGEGGVAMAVSGGESRGHGRTVERDVVAEALETAAAAWAARREPDELREALMAIIAGLSRQPPT
jgi:hypothetical protein